MYAFLLFFSLFFFQQSAHAIDNDKKLHFGASSGIGLSSTLVFEKPLNSFLACSSVGLVKEIYDEIDYGGFDEKDIFYNLAGCALGVTIGEGSKRFILKPSGIEFKYRF